MEPGVTAKAMVLIALLEGPSYGRRLIETIRRRTANRVRLVEGSLYPALRGLEREGAILGWPAPGARGRPRRYYELSASGLIAAREQRRLLASFGASPALPPPPAVRRAMAGRIQACAELSAFLIELRDKAAG